MTRYALYRVRILSMPIMWLFGILKIILLLYICDNLIVDSLAGVGSCLEDNSCKSDASCLVEDDINTNINKFISRMAEYSIFIDGFDMNASDAEGEKPASGAKTYSDGTPILYDTAGNVLPLCSVPTQKIKFCYSPVGGSRQCFTMDPTSVTDNYKYIQGAFFRSIDTGSKICIQVLGSLGWTTMGCKYNTAGSTMSLAYDPCYVSPSCADRAKQHSKGFFPMSSVIVECVKESVEKAMLSEETCKDEHGNVKVNILPQMQNALRKTVMSALMLYVVLFGIRTALGPSAPDKGEWFVFVMKMILVLYFSVGIYMGNKTTNPHSAYSVNSSYEDGLSKYLVPYSMGIANSLANIAFQAGGNSNLCSYTPCTLCQHCAGCVDYDPGYEYLALWDALDCRIAFYFLIVAPKDAAGQIGGSGINSSVPLPIFNYNIFSAIGAAFFSLQILFIILALCFAILFVSVCVFFIHTYVIALIAIGIMIYIAPIFVPMALFKPTKAYFDGWSRMLLSFIMQPMVISGFLALMLTIFDQAFYTNCEWNKSVVSGSTPFFEFATNQPDACQKSFGYAMAKMLSSDSVISTKTAAIFFDISVLSSLPNNVFNGLLVIVIFSCLFYFFAESVSAIAADITGGPSLGALAIGPNAITNKALDLAEKAVNLVMAAFTVATAGAGAGVTVATQTAKQAAKEAAKQAVRAGVKAATSAVKEGTKSALQSGAESTTQRGGNTSNNQATKSQGISARTDFGSSSESSSGASRSETVTRKDLSSSSSKSTEDKG
ncbi:Type IV secretion system protein virB6 [Rickettsiales bacterium Ac37b]|nr:Type IV secretion system protein virB6 [Rickettsiales bacterium Ac37b]